VLVGIFFFPSTVQVVSVEQVYQDTAAVPTEKKTWSLYSKPKIRDGILADLQRAVEEEDHGIWKVSAAGPLPAVNSGVQHTNVGAAMAPMSTDHEMITGAETCDRCPVHRH
jgi:hypothetical protein